MSLSSYIHKEYRNSGICIDEATAPVITVAVLLHHVEDMNEGIAMMRRDPIRGRAIAEFSRGDIEEIIDSIGSKWRENLLCAFHDFRGYNKFVRLVEQALSVRF